MSETIMTDVELAAFLARMPEIQERCDAEMEEYWWCQNCTEEISPTRVTFQERHDTCGHPAQWINPAEDDLAAALSAIRTLRAKLERYESGEDDP